MRLSLVSVAFATFAAACGGASEQQIVAPKPPGQDRVQGLTDDRSRCTWVGRSDREVSESRAPGAYQPNIRRVFGVIGEGDERRRVLLCREVDTNLDGVKDMVRTYNEKGEAMEEQADSNYDGRIDTWMRFSNGRISKVEVDTDNNGMPDEAHYYVKGELNRVQRDANHDGKADVWEIYREDKLQRMGTDVDHDGHVDRWDRDEVARREAETKERAEEAEREREAAEKKKQEEKAVEEGKAAAEGHVSPRKR